MAKSGITRRIDELGRIVIPKEMRRNLKIQDCDEIDISLDGNSIILNKHEINDNSRVINLLIHIISKYLNMNVVFTSKEKIIYYCLINKRKFDNLELDDSLKEIIKNRKTIDNEELLSLLNNEKCFYIINPLIINGDLFGSLILFNEKEIKDIDKKILGFSKMFLENYLE